MRLLSILPLLLLPFIPAHAQQEQQSPSAIGVFFLAEATEEKLFVLCSRQFGEGKKSAELTSLEVAHREFKKQHQATFEQAHETLRRNVSGREQVEAGFYIAYHSQSFVNMLDQLEATKKHTFCRNFVESLESRQFDPESFPSPALMKLLGRNVRAR